MPKIKTAIFILLIITIIFFYFSNLSSVLTLQNIKTQHFIYKSYYHQYPIRFICIYLLTYIFLTTFSIPFANLLTLMAGAIFGLWFGTLLVILASTTGATGAFWLARFFLKDFIESKFKTQSKLINSGIEKDGAYYLLSLRLIPIFPFFLINLLMGITQIKTYKFFAASFLGMLPAVFLYVNAGTELIRINSPRDIMTPAILGSFLLIGLTPLIFKSLKKFINN